MNQRYSTVLIYAVMLPLCVLNLSHSQVLLDEPFMDNGYWGFKFLDGTVAIEPRFLLARPFNSRGIAAVVDDSGWIYIDRDGKKLIRPFIFDNGPDYFSEGLARFLENNKIGFFDEAGRIMIEARFQFVLPFSEGMAAFCEGGIEDYIGEHAVFQNGKWGYIDKTGEIVVEALYEHAENYANGEAIVKKNGRTFILNKQGKIIR